MERLSEEINQVMEQVAKGLESAGHEIAEEKSRQQEKRSGGSGKTEAPEMGDIAKDISQEAEQLIEKARPTAWTGCSVRRRSP